MAALVVLCCVSTEAVGQESVADLGARLASDDSAAQTAAYAALERMVHHAARPGAPAEARAVANDLLRLTDAAQSKAARIAALRLLACVATAEHVGALAGLLSDDAVCEEVCLTLEDLPGTAATEALLKAMPNLEGSIRRRVILALGQRGDVIAVAPLRELARGALTDLDTAWACIEALARLGISPTEIRPRSAEFSSAESLRYAVAGMEAANVLLRQGHRAEAERILLAFTESYTPPHLVSATLQGLKAADSNRLLQIALGRLNDPQTRQVIIDTLVTAQTPGIDKDLESALPMLDAPARATALDILAQRKAEGIDFLLKKAMEDKDAEVRVAAFRLAEIAASDADLDAVIRDGSSWARASAVEIALARVDAWLVSGESNRARALCETIAGAPVAIDARSRALNTLEHVADPTSRRVLSPLLEDPSLAEPAARVLIAMAAKDPQDAHAPNDMLHIIEKLPSGGDVVAAAAEQLRLRGLDTDKIANDKGFVTAWRVIGPFSSPGPEVDAAILAGLDGAEVVVDGKPYAWQPASTQGFPPAVLVPAERESVIYLQTSISSDTRKAAQLEMETPSRCAAWVNGTQVLEDAPATEPIKSPWRVRIMLNKGPNGVLVRIRATGEGACIRARVRGIDGRPIGVPAGSVSST